LTTALQALKDNISGNINSVPSATLNMFLLAGGGTGLNMIFGAMTFVVTMWTISSATKILGQAQS